MTLRTLRIAVTLAVIASAAALNAQEITVAAAADLQFAFQDVAARFEKQSGSRVKLVFGSSGNFFAQIQNGAPFDVFCSADLGYPQKLEAAGLTEPGSLYRYATGKIVLWVPKASPVDLGQGLAALLDPDVHKIAIANPTHAPYGRAAVAALQHEKIYQRVSAKLVLGESVSQAASFVVSGSADAGIVALSLALAPAMKEKGRYAGIPADDYPAIVQAAVLLKPAQQTSVQRELARRFLNFLKDPAIVEVMRGYGFSAPQTHP